jgi:uncharacterized membrane protein
LADESHVAHRFVQWVLRAGLAIACVLIAIGLVIALASGEHAAAVVRFHHVLSDGTLADRVMACGLVLLAMTPAIRVLSLVAIWIVERDRRFAIVGFVVMIVLGAAILTGHG